MTLTELCTPHTEGEPYYDILPRLLTHAIPGDAIEVGLGAGYTHLALHRAAGDRRVIGIDNLSNQPLFQVNLDNITSWVRDEERTPHILVMDSVEAVPFLTDIQIAFLFLDADHTYEAAVRDMEAYFPLVIPGGTICVHDTEQAGVTQALDEMKPLVSEEVTWLAPDGGGDKYPRTMWTGITKAGGR